MNGALMGVSCAVRIMLFVGGPSTTGGGMIVNTELSEAIRSHKVIKPHGPTCSRNSAPTAYPVSQPRLIHLPFAFQSGCLPISINTHHMTIKT